MTLRFLVDMNALLMAVSGARGACGSHGCPAAAAQPVGGLTPFPGRSAPRRALATCALPGESFYFSAITEGPAQIAGEKNKGAIHIGGQLTLSTHYATKVPHTGACPGRDRAAHVVVRGGGPHPFTRSPQPTHCG